MYLGTKILKFFKTPEKLIREENLHLQNEVNLLKDEKKVLSAENSLLKGEKKALSEENEVLKDEKKRFEEEKKDLLAKIADLEAQPQHQQPLLQPLQQLIIVEEVKVDQIHHPQPRPNAGQIEGEEVKVDEVEVPGIRLPIQKYSSNERKSYFALIHRYLSESLELKDFLTHVNENFSRAKWARRYSVTKNPVYLKKTFLKSYPQFNQ